MITNPTFLIPTSLQPDVVDRSNLKQKIRPSQLKTYNLKYQRFTEEEGGGAAPRVLEWLPGFLNGSHEF